MKRKKERNKETKRTSTKSENRKFGKSRIKNLKK